jgi:hypothetical protein
MGSGFRTLPVDLKAQIDAVGNRRFVFGAVRPYSAALEAQWTTGLKLESVGDGEWIGLPGRETGRWSAWNINGREVVRKDLPKVYKSWTTEAPNFNGIDTHSIHHGKDVYQRQHLYGAQIEAAVRRVDEPRDLLVGTVLLELRGPFSEDNESDYLYAASLARTWFGSATLLELDEVGVVQVPDHSVTWEFLPDGTADETRVALVQRLGGTRTPQEIEIMVDRIERVRSLQPESRLIGSTGLQRYIGYKFGDDFVAFENPRVGNALYLLYGDWESLSQLSRSELLRSRGGEYDRIVHTANWFSKLRIAVYDYRHRA